MSALINPLFKKLLVFLCIASAVNSCKPANYRDTLPKNKGSRYSARAYAGFMVAAAAIGGYALVKKARMTVVRYELPEAREAAGPAPSEKDMRYEEEVRALRHELSKTQQQRDAALAEKNSALHQQNTLRQRLAQLEQHVAHQEQINRGNWAQFQVLGASHHNLEGWYARLHQDYYNLQQDPQRLQQQAQRNAGAEAQSAAPHNAAEPAPPAYPGKPL